MKYFKAYKKEYSGYECDGHYQLYIVVANNESEVHELLDDKEEYGEKATDIKEIIFPNISRRKKPFIFL